MSKAKKSRDELTPLLSVQAQEEGGLFGDVIPVQTITPWSNMRLALLLVFFVACSVVALVARKAMMSAYGSKYVFFRQELTNLMYNVWALLIVGHKLLLTDDITPEMRRFPIWKFCFIGLMDGLSDLLQSIGGVDTPGSWQVLMNQTVVFFTIAMSFALLGSRFNWLQVVGAILTLGGAALGIVPSLGGSGTVLSTLLYLAGIFPQSLSYVYKEKVFKGVNLDVVYLSCCVSWLQLLLTWAFVPLTSLHGLGGIALKDIPSVFADGARCFAGNERIPVYDGEDVIGHCSSYVTLITFVFSLAGFAAGIAQLTLLKHGSTVLMSISNGITLPLSSLVFALHFIMGKQTEAFTWYSAGGLVVVLGGFAAYVAGGSEFQRRKKDV